MQMSDMILDLNVVERKVSIASVKGAWECSETTAGILWGRAP